MKSSALINSWVIKRETKWVYQIKRGQKSFILVFARFPEVAYLSKIFESDKSAEIAIFLRKDFVRCRSEAGQRRGKSVQIPALKKIVPYFLKSKFFLLTSV